MPDITVPLAELGQPAAARPAMTFAVVNGQRVPVEGDAPATISVPLTDLQKPAAAAAPAEADDFGSHYLSQINPIPLGQILPFPKALGGAGFDAPLQAARKLLQAQGEVFDRARAAYDQGDHVGAAIHALNWLLPVIGPVIDKAGVELRNGKAAASMGDTLGLSTALFGPEAISAATARPVPGMGTMTRPTAPGGGGGAGAALTADDLAANGFAHEHGIPLTYSQQTGSAAARGVEKIAGESFLGEKYADATRQAQRAGLQQAGEGLADQVRPGAVSPEEGGSGARQSITETIQSLKGSADVAYGRVRDVEAMPEHTETVHTAPRGSSGYRQILERLKGGLTGQNGVRVRLNPSEPELYTMRQIEAELDAQPFQRGRAVDHGSEFGSDVRYARGSANADVYHEIQQAAGTDSLTGADMKEGIGRTLETGEWNAASYAAYKVAQERVRAAGGGIGKGPRLQDSAPILGRAEQVQLPVDVSGAKGFLESLHDELRRANEVTPLQGDLAQAYRAIDRLMTGPDRASLTTADAARSSLLKLARTDDPLFRSRGQGVASRAAAELDKAIQAKAAEVPELQQALEQGRAATKGKYDVGAVLDQLPDEPVKAFDKLTAPRDGNIDLLRQVQQIAPEKMADVGRAKLQQWLDLATERGRFDHADRLYAEWQKLGPQTKRILFGDDPKLAQSLDQFFLLAKRLQENANPSGTAGTLTKIAEVTGPVSAIASLHPLAAIGSIAGSVGMGQIAKLLYTPKGVEALTEFLRSGAKQPAARGAGAATRAVGSAAALDRLALVAKGQGVDLGLAADRDEKR